MAAFNPGQIVGSYRIIELLGQGGMATVYKAQHTKLKRYVALKVMYPSFMNDPNFTTRFEREAQIIARLEHPNIVPVHDYAEENGMFYLVMKFIEGVSLQQILADGPLELSDIRTVMSAICGALNYAHNQGVLHRDIKPSNIMIDNKATPYLTDFGLARDVFDGESSISQGMMIGTPAYMSPEQALGQRELDSRSDIYSLGIVLYQLLVGKAPFEGGSTYAVLHKHQTEIPPMPSSLNPEIPPAVEVVVLRAIAKDPDDRYATAAALHRALEDALNSSQLRQLNPGDRHNLITSLSQPRNKSVVGQGFLQLTPPNRSVQDAPTKDRRGARSTVPLPAEALRKKQGSNNRSLIMGLVAGIIVIAFIIILLVVNSQSPQSNIGIANVPRQSMLPSVSAAPTDEPEVSVVTEEASPSAVPVTETPAPSAMPPTVDTRPVATEDLQLPPPTTPLTDPNSGAPPPPGAAPADDFSPFPDGIEPYTIAAANLSQAEALVAEEPDNPAVYLALAQAQLYTRTSMDIVRDTLQEAATHSDEGRYVVSLQSMLQHAGLPPDALFTLYTELLQQMDADGTIGAPIRERIGAHLYDMIERGVIQRFLLTRLNNDLPQDADSLMFAMMAKLFVAHSDLRLAEASLNRANADEPEVKLIRGELLAAQGETDEAREIWEALASDGSVARWIQRRAEQNLLSTG